MTHPPTVGAWTPWGVADQARTLLDGIVDVATPSHGGLWLAPARQAALPDLVRPMHGRAWYEEDCEAAVVILAFADLPDREAWLGAALRSLAMVHAAWLDALAPDHGLPNTAQIARIDALWTRYARPGRADPAAFRAGPGSSPGFVEGAIGGTWFGIAPDGRAHS